MTTPKNKDKMVSCFKIIQMLKLIDRNFFLVLCHQEANLNVLHLKHLFYSIVEPYM